MVAPSIVGHNQVVTGSVTSVTLPVPSGTLDGHLLLAFISCRRTVTAINAPAGWTLVDSVVSGGRDIWGIYKRVASSEPTSYNWTTNVAGGIVAGMVCIENADSTVYYSGHQSSDGASGPITAPAITSNPGGGLTLRFGTTAWGADLFTGNWSDSAVDLWRLPSAISSSSGCCSVLSSIAGTENTAAATIAAGTSWVAGATIVLAPTQAIAAELILDWKLEAEDISKELILDWTLNNTLSKSMVLDWKLISYITAELALKWNVLDESSEPSIYWDINTQRVTGFTNIFSSASLTTIPSEELIMMPVAQTPPDHVILPDGIVGAIELDFFGDYYFRIWMDPLLRRLTNPRIGVDLPFSVWNAYPYDNTLTDATLDDLDGVELQFDTPLDFSSLEYKTLYYQITSDAPIELDGYINLTFDYGEGALHIIAQIVDVMPILQNDPVVETWSWLTVVQASYSNWERRTAYLIEPRVAMSFTVQITDEILRQKVYSRLWNFIARGMQYPFFQYATEVDAAIIGSSSLVFDPTLTDLRDDEYVVLYDPSNDDIHLVQIDTLSDTGATLKATLDFSVSSGWLIVPTQSMVIPDGSALRMRAVEGDIQFSASSLEYRELRRDGADVTLPTFDDLYVLDKRPIADDDIPEEFHGGGEVIDNGTAKPVIYSAFTNSFVSSTNQWLVDRETEMDWWKELAWQLRGQQKKFLMPTWRQDVILQETPDLGTTVLIVKDASIIDLWAFDTYKRIQIETANDIVWRKINTATLNDDGYAELTLDLAIGSNEGDNVFNAISFLNLVCLDNDVIGWRHSRNYSIVTLSTRTVLT